jgi:hypothetical protein
MKTFTIIALLCLANRIYAATVVAPNDLENKEGDTSVIGLFGGNARRTQVIYDRRHFSLFPPEGASIVELRFRLDSGRADFSTTVDLEIRLSTSDQGSDGLGTILARNVGPDETIVLPRTLLTLSGVQTSPNGPNSFSVVIPLPNQFFYNPSNGNLLMDAFVYDPGATGNLDWDTGFSDGVSIASGAISATFASTISRTAPVTQFVFVPVPESSTITLTLVGATIFTCFRRKYVIA